MKPNDIVAALALLVAVTSAPWFVPLISALAESISTEFVVAVYGATWVLTLNVWMLRRIERRLTARLDKLEGGSGGEGDGSGDGAGTV